MKVFIWLVLVVSVFAYSSDSMGRPLEMIRKTDRKVIVSVDSKCAYEKKFTPVTKHSWRVLKHSGYTFSYTICEEKVVGQNEGMIYETLSRKKEFKNFNSLPVRKEAAVAHGDQDFVNKEKCEELRAEFEDQKVENEASEIYVKCLE